MLKRVYKYSITTIPIHLIMLVTALLPNSGATTKLRGMLIRPFIGKCGKGFKIASGVVLNKPSNLIIGDNVYIAHNVWINAVGGLQLEDGVVISPFCVLDTSKHLFNDEGVTHKSEKNSISIRKGTWIAAHTVIKDGISIGEKSLIGAGSIVTKNISSKKFAAGVPAKELKNM